jgi:polysaccharide pyruvyl transferase WcaK-like protein
LALREAGHDRVRILCNDSRDLDFAVQFKGSLNVDPVYTNDVYQYLAILAGCSMLVSYRLHATLPAISFGKSVVNITYDERAESLCEDLGVQKHSIKIVNSSRDVSARIDEAIRSGGYVSSEDNERKLKWKEIGVLQDGLVDRFKESVLNYVTAIKSG